METVNIDYCQTNLSQILSLVQLGEEIIIANGDIPVAKLVPVSSTSRLASLGQYKDKFIVPEDFNEPLPPEILAAFEGEVGRNYCEILNAGCGGWLKAVICFTIKQSLIIPKIKKIEAKNDRNYYQ